MMMRMRRGHIHPHPGRNGDEDACFVADFEEQILVACQESSQLAACSPHTKKLAIRLKEKPGTEAFGHQAPTKDEDEEKGMAEKGKDLRLGRRVLHGRLVATCSVEGKPWRTGLPTAIAESVAVLVTGNVSVPGPWNGCHNSSQKAGE